MPSASASATLDGTPSALSTSTTRRCRTRTRSASACPFSVRNTPRYGRAVANPARFRRAIVFTAVACDTPSRRAMSVGRASPGAPHQIGDEFDVIFQKRCGLRSSRFSEAAGLRSFRGKLFRGGTALASCRVVHGQAASGVR